MPDEMRQDLQRVGLDNQFFMVGPIKFRYHAGVVGLVIFPGRKADREGLDSAAAGARHHRHDGRRIDPAG